MVLPVQQNRGVRGDPDAEFAFGLQERDVDVMWIWPAEIEEITSADLQGKSRDMLRDTQTRYGQLMTAMRSAESKMAPVLTAFKDQVLFLKHNLNAQAIASLKDSVLGIEGDVDALIANMQASIDEADAFIASMSS